LVKFYKEAQKSLKEGASLADIRAMPVITSLLKAKFEITDDQIAKLDDIDKQMPEQFRKMVAREEVKVIV
jgi:V/A-type H+/Na+-transporting ATPase subunit A